MNTKCYIGLAERRRGIDVRINHIDPDAASTLLAESLSELGYHATVGDWKTALRNVLDLSHTRAPIFRITLLDDGELGECALLLRHYIIQRYPIDVTVTLLKRS